MDESRRTEWWTVKVESTGWTNRLPDWDRTKYTECSYEITKKSYLYRGLKVIPNREITVPEGYLPVHGVNWSNQFWYKKGKPAFIPGPGSSKK